MVSNLIWLEELKHSNAFSESMRNYKERSQQVESIEELDNPLTPNDLGGKLPGIIEQSHNPAEGERKCPHLLSGQTPT